MDIIYKNSEKLHRSDLRIALDDRSFRFGDGCFETIPFFSKNFLYLNAHLARLRETLSLLKITLDLSPIAAQLASLVAESPYTDGICRIICSRGEGSRGFLPNENCEAYYILECQENSAKLPAAVQLHLSSYTRFGSNILPTSGKLNNGLNSVLARLEAAENACFESILCDSDGFLCEGSSSNICLKLGSDYVFVKSDAKLNGITEMVMKNAFPIAAERQLPVAALAEASAVYLMNSGYGVVAADGVPSIGKVYQKQEDDPFIAAYAAQIEKVRHA